MNYCLKKIQITLLLGIILLTPSIAGAYGQTDEGNLRIREFYRVGLPPDTSSTENVPMEYELGLGINIESGNIPLDSATLSLTNPYGYSTEDIEPEPDVTGDPLIWYTGYIPLDEEWEMQWDVPDQTWTHTPGFTSTRNIDTTTLSGTELIQTTTITVTPTTTDELRIVHEYDEDYLQIEVLSYSGPGDAWVDDGIQVNYEIETPTPDQELQFTITCRVTRQPWVVGELEVYPSTRVTIWNFEKAMLPAPVTGTVEVGEFVVNSDPSVFWDYRYEENYAVIYEGEVKLNRGELLLLEYHLEYVSHDTGYLGPEPRELYYMLHTKIETEESLLENTVLEYNNINDWTDYNEIEPYPDEIGTDYVHWILGDLENDDVWIFWNDEDRTYQESQGFEVTRTIDNTVIPDGKDCIYQTTTFEIEHYETTSKLYAGVEYDDEYVSVELVDGNQLEDANDWDRGIEWTIDSDHDQHQVLWVTYRVTRQPGIEGDLEVYPKSRTDSRLYDHFYGDPNENVEFGQVIASTSNAVQWEIVKESSNTVWWRDRYSYNTASIIVRENRGLWTDALYLPNEPITHYAHPDIGVENHDSPNEDKLHDLRITLDAENLREYQDWWVWGDRPYPNDYLEDPESIWDYNRWNWNTVENDQEVEVGINYLNYMPVEDTPGYSLVREATPMVFNEQTTQHITITLQVEESIPEQEIDLKLYTNQNNDATEAYIISGTCTPEPDEESSEEVKWELPHNPGIYVYETDIEVTPLTGAPYETTYVPGIETFITISDEAQPGFPVYTNEIVLNDVTVTPESGTMGDIYVTTNEPVTWIEAQYHYFKVTQFEEISKASIDDNESPIVTIISPNDNGIYQAGSEDTIQFTITDNLDPEPTINAYIYDVEDNANRVQNGDHLPIISGDYRLIVEARDEAGNIGTDEVQFIVFDPESGFVTGGGWIKPEHKANFGFVSKYKKNSATPKGNFHFNTRDLKMKGTEIEWMTVSEDTAVFQGVCTVNKQGTYTYQVTVYDRYIEGDQPDGLHLRIWDTQDTETDPVYIYSGDLMGGNIVVHSQLEYFDIGVTSSSDPGNDVTYILTDMAKQDINQYCIEEDIPYRFNYIVKENHGNSGTALQNTIDFNEAGINLVAGHGWSSQCQASLDYVNNNDMLLFSSSSTSPTLAIDDNLYRLTTNDLVSGQVNAELLQIMNVQGIAILYRGDLWGSGLNQVVLDECQERGISVISSIEYATNDMYFNDELAQIETSITDSGHTVSDVGFLVISFNEVTEILRCAEDNYPSLLDVTWYGGDGTAQSYDILDAEPALVTQVKLYSPYVSPIYDDTLYQSFASRLEAIDRVSSFYNAAKYDILILYAEAVINTGTSDTELVRAELEDLVVDYHGASGYSTFDCNGDRMGADYDIWGYDIVDGEPSIIKYGHYYLETDQITIYP